MAGTKFVSIRHKLIVKITQVLVVAFGIVLCVETFFSVRSSAENLATAEANIRSSILARGRILVKNNSLALAGMVVDNAFTAVKSLVDATVANDDDIVYGIYMDEGRRPWVVAKSKGSVSSMATGQPLSDEVSGWAQALQDVNHTLIQQDGLQVYEFAAPVFVENERLGTIRYGISTQTMQRQLQAVRDQSRRNMLQSISTLLFITLIVFLFVYAVVKRFAVLITDPIGKLTRSAEIIAGGDYANVVGVESDDEIGLLANNFDRMRCIVKHKINDLSGINTTAEQLALQHTRYNTAHKAFEAFCSHSNVVSGAMYIVGKDNELTMEYRYPRDDGSVCIDDPVLDPVHGPVKFFLNYRDIFVSHNAMTDERLSDFLHRITVPVALIAIPIFDQEKHIGVSLIVSKADDFNFHADDYEYFRALGRLLSISLKNIAMREVIHDHSKNLEKMVEERTESLRKKTSDIVNMMKSLHQGLFTIGDCGKIQDEYSSHMEKIFETEDIQNRDFAELLFSSSGLTDSAVDLTKETVFLLVNSDQMTFFLNKHLLPDSYERISSLGEVRYIELDWNPIYDGDFIEKIMVTVRDVTEIRQLEAETKIRQKELQAIAALLHIDKYRFYQFVRSSQSCISRTSKVIQHADAGNIEHWQAIMRDMHTLKGNARTLAFEEIADNVHNMESMIEPMVNGKPSATMQNTLFNQLEKLAESVRFYENIAAYKLEWREDQDENRPVTVSQDILNQGIELLQGIISQDGTKNTGAIESNIQDALALLKRLAYLSLNDVIQPILDSLPRLAASLDKLPPKIVLDIHHIYINKQNAQVVANAFTHILRNALDHGIELPVERQRRGKDAAGLITISAQRDGADLFLSIKDDGRGLNLLALSESTEEDAKLTVTAPEIANRVFKAGVSTAAEVNNVSGRGVGLNAVKHDLRESGADVKIILEGENTELKGYHYIKFNIQLPDTLFFC